MSSSSVDREAEHAGAEAEDQQELDQVVDRQPEEAVEVAGLEQRLRVPGDAPRAFGWVGIGRLQSKIVADAATTLAGCAEDQLVTGQRIASSASVRKAAFADPTAGRPRSYGAAVATHGAQ